MFPWMLALLVPAEGLAWYGPATATFPVQFAGDPATADVRVRFLGERNEREERAASFDPVLGAWRATLYAKEGGRFRAVLVRDGHDALVEPVEGIVELRPRPDAGLVRAAERSGRLLLDRGGVWVGLGADLGTDPTPAKVDALADAGANWVRLAPPTERSPEFDAAMERVAQRSLFYTLAVPEKASAAWRRDALARYGSSPYLAQWEAPADLPDPWNRATASTAEPWPALFENRPGPFVVKAGDAARVKALRTVLDTSDWANWTTPRTWKGAGAKGVVESDRLVLVAEPGARLAGIPLAEGDYDLTTVDPAAGTSVVGRLRVGPGALPLPVPAERFFVLRRRV